jgi:hypothetical protein
VRGGRGLESVNFFTGELFPGLKNGNLFTVIGSVFSLVSVFIKNLFMDLLGEVVILRTGLLPDL